MKTPHIAVSLALVTLALAGCASVTEKLGTANATNASPMNVVPKAHNATLFLTTAGALATEAPAQEGYVTMPAPVNGPFIGGDPEWRSSAAVPTATNVSIRLFVTTSSASVAADTFPLVPFPALDVWLSTGNETARVGLDAPQVLKTGEIVEVRGHATLKKPLEEGPLRIEITPYYTHVGVVAEFRFVMGPQHPASVTLS